MKKLINFIIVFLLLTTNIYAADESKKSLTKKETISFLKEYAIILEDERSDGEVTYVFDDENYSRYKGIEVISTDAWRFSKLGALRLFNRDIKMSWKIKITDGKNLINIKTKYDPIGKLYKFTIMDKQDFLDQIEQIKLAEKQKKEAAKKAEIEKKKKQEEDKLVAEQKLEEEKQKLEEERLAAEQKLEEEKKKLEEEKLALQKELEELKKKRVEEEKERLAAEQKLEEERLAAEQKLEEEKQKLEKERLAAEQKLENEKTPAQIKKEEKERKKQEKLAAKQKAKEEKERIKQEKVAAKQKAKEEGERKKKEELAENKKLEQEKLEAKEKAEAKKLVEEKQKKIIAATDWNKMLDYIANRLMLTSQSTPGIGEFQLLNCMMNTMKPEYLSGTFLFDGMYDGGPRKDMYYKMKKIFDDMDNDILKMSVNCSSSINQFAR